MILIALMPGLVVLVCHVCAAMTRAPRKFRWWLYRIGLAPLLCSAFAFYIIATPRSVPADWNPMTDPNYGRLDFAAAMIWGVGFPIFYLAVAVPVAIAWIFWKKRCP